MALFIYLHGLNTFEDGKVHIGPLQLGSLTLPITSELKKQTDPASKWIVPEVLPALSPDEQAEYVWSRFQLSQTEANSTVFIIGHSYGGLTARALQTRFFDQSDSKNVYVLSIATPHRGTPLSNLAGHQGIRRFEGALKRYFNYDLERRRKTFSNLGSRQIESFNLRYPANDKTYSVTAGASLRDLSYCFWPLYSQLNGQGLIADGKDLLLQRQHAAWSDGVVPIASQRWGKTLGHFQADHLAQIGYFNFSPRPGLAKSQFHEILKLTGRWSATLQNKRDERPRLDVSAIL